MRVLFSSTIGSGHVRPLLPFMQTFKARGHEVCLAGPRQIVRHAKDLGIAFAEVDRAPEAEIQALWQTRHGLPRQEIVRLAVQQMFAGLCAVPALPGLLVICERWRPDLIVRETSEMAAPVAAARHAVPSIRVEVHNTPGETWYLDHGPAPIDDMRQSVGLPPDAGQALLCEPAFTAFPGAFDPTVEWTTRRAPVRYRQGRSAAVPASARPNWRPEDKTPLLYVTFGTEAGEESYQRDAYRFALEAIGALPVHALLTTGHRMEHADLGKIPGNVTVEAFVPQEEVFALAAAIVHHGGSGTLLGALAAGLPHVVVPLMADQFSNGDNVERVGAGLTLPDRSGPGLRSAIESVLYDGRFLQGAGRIAAEMRQQMSVADAVSEMQSVAA